MADTESSNPVEDNLVSTSELIEEAERPVERELSGPPDDPAAVIKSRGKGLDLDDPEAMTELARSLRVDPALIEGYVKAQNEEVVPVPVEVEVAVPAR